jgi:hypothetical protein
LYNEPLRTSLKNGWIFTNSRCLKRWSLNKKNVEHSFTSLGGGESSTMWHPKKKGRKEFSDAHKKEKTLEKHARKKG